MDHDSPGHGNSGPRAGARPAGHAASSATSVYPVLAGRRDPLPLMRKRRGGGSLLASAITGRNLAVATLRWDSGLPRALAWAGLPPSVAANNRTAGPGPTGTAAAVTHFDERISSRGDPVPP